MEHDLPTSDALADQQRAAGDAVGDAVVEEQSCTACGGSGRTGDGPCAACDGRGKVAVPVGGG